MTRVWSAAILSIVVMGCSGGDDDDDGGGGTLTSGVYVVTSVSQSTDECGLGPAVSQNDTLSITVTGNSINIAGQISGDIDGSSIDAPDPDPVQESFDDGVDPCSATTRDDFSGTITGDDEFSLVEEFEVTVSSPGGNCPYDACESRFTYVLAK